MQNILAVAAVSVLLLLVFRICLWGPRGWDKLHSLEGSVDGTTPGAPLLMLHINTEELAVFAFRRGFSPADQVTIPAIASLNTLINGQAYRIPKVLFLSEPGSPSIVQDLYACAQLQRFV